MSLRTNGVSWATTTGAMLLLCNAILACDTPVFRYALEKWRPDPYPVVIFHKGGLSDAQQNAVMLLQQQSEDDKTNVLVDVVNLDGGVPEGARKLYDGLPDKTLPRLVVMYPARSGGKGVMHSSALSAEDVQAAMDSAARQELVKRLLGGDSAVWVVLDGDKESDNEAVAKVVREQIAVLPDLVDISQPLTDLSVDPEGAPGANITSWPSKLQFSMLRIARNDPRESLFVKMMLAVEQDLAEGQYASEPVVIPVFGRGRGLYALVGKGVTADNMRKAAEFLAGACACEVKDLNPGVDMLMTADWDRAVGDPQFVEIQLPDLVPVSAESGANAQTQPATAAVPPADAPVTPAAPEDAKPPSPSRGGGRTIFWTVLAALGVLLAAAAALSMILRSRGAGNR